MSDLPGDDLVDPRSKVEIAAEPRSGAGAVLRDILRQLWFTSLCLFVADLSLVTGAYLLSRTIRVNHALIMSPAYLVQIGAFFACILVEVLGAAAGAFVLFVFFSAGDFYTAQSRVVLFYTAIGYALPALGLRLLTAMSGRAAPAASPTSPSAHQRNWRSSANTATAWNSTTRSSSPTSISTSSAN